MTQKIVSTVAVLLSVFILVSVAAAATPHAVTATSGPDTVAVTAGFTPDKLGASTIATGGGVFTTTAGPIPSPLVGLTIKGPAGLGLDLTGAKTCSEDIIYGPIGDKGFALNHLLQVQVAD